VVYNGAVISSQIIFKPMLSPDLSATYNDYQPYSMTNRELTEAVTADTFSFALNGYDGTPNFTINYQQCQKVGRIHQVYIRLDAIANIAANTQKTIGTVQDILTTNHNYPGIITKRATGARVVGGCIITYDGSVQIEFNEAVASGDKLLLQAMCID
jgi:hypothetical protein